MRKNVLRIFSGLLVIVMLSVAIVPASAVDDFGGGSYGGGISRSDFFTWTEGFGGGSFGGGASREQSKAAYDDYVQTLPATGYDSSGGLMWSPSYAGIRMSPYDWQSGTMYFCPHATRYYGENNANVSKYLLDKADYLSYSCGCNGNGHFEVFAVDFAKSYHCWSVNYLFVGEAPVTGTYTLLLGLGGRASWGVNGSTFSNVSADFTVGTPTFYSKSAPVTCSLEIILGRYAKFSVLSVDCNLPVYKVTPNTAFSGDTYNTNTRPTSITGGNYGIVGDNGQITKVEDNSTIVNETNNTFYNPATGQTVPITGWSYDYSDRSYKVTMEGGKTSTITYGDENISITETTVNESGDTITNNYTIYYLIDGTGSENPPSACEHTWTETSSTDPICTLPGKVTLSCTKCQQTKTETLPALGHNWQVKQTVTTQYDETGQLIQEGYTIFECSRCHEQYKSPDGSIPPGGGSGTDPGGDEGETIWDKLGNLIGAIGGGVIGLIDAALGKVLDALIVLAEKMMEKLKVVVETVLSIFDELPALFGGFLAFLVALFPFLPPEIMTILTFGVIAIVFIGIIKAVRR